MAFFPSPNLENSTERSTRPFLKPWRGVLVIHGLQLEGNDVPQGLVATAVETDGNTCADLWPPSFVVQSAQQPSVLSEVHEWARQNAPPLCTFVPDRLRNADDDAINQTLYQTLSRMLLLNQTVAIASWDSSDRLPGAGIIIYPAQYKNAILAGAIFLTERFPDFINSASMSSSPVDGPSVPHVLYQHPLGFSPSFPSTSQHHYLHHSASLPVISYANEHSTQEYPRRGYATEHPSQDPHQQYSHIVPSASYTYPANSPGIRPWLPAKEEEKDDLDLSEFSSGLAGGHGRSHFHQ